MCRVGIYIIRLGVGISPGPGEQARWGPFSESAIHGCCCMSKRLHLQARRRRSLPPSACAPGLQMVLCCSSHLQDQLPLYLSEIFERKATNATRTHLSKNELHAIDCSVATSWPKDHKLNPNNMLCLCYFATWDSDPMRTLLFLSVEAQI